MKVQPKEAPGVKRVGVFAAKTHFSALIDHAIAGKTTIITKRGKSVALVVPVDDTRRERTRQAIERLRAIRGALKLGPGETIRDLIDAGRH